MGVASLRLQTSFDLDKPSLTVSAVAHFLKREVSNAVYFGTFQKTRIQDLRECIFFEMNCKILDWDWVRLSKKKLLKSRHIFWIGGFIL